MTSPRTAWLVGSLLLLAACTSSSAERISLHGPDGQAIAIDAEIADTLGLQQKGLMGRTSLGPNEGMLFVFSDLKKREFWMKDTLIPLDILFFRADGSFVSSAEMVPCVNDPCAIYVSTEPAATALEVPSGFVRSRGVGSGWALAVE